MRVCPLIEGGSLLQWSLWCDAMWKSSLWVVNTVYRIDAVRNGQFDSVYGSEYQLFGELSNHYLKVKVQGNTTTFTAIRSSDGSTIIEYILER